jgi:hypothetical protein
MVINCSEPIPNLSCASLHAPTPQVLEKTYLLEPEDEVIPKQFIGCKIDWKDAALDPTVEQVRAFYCL